MGKTNLQPWTMLQATSKSATFNTDVHESIAYFGYSVQVNITSASGLDCDLTLEASNDKENWATVQDSTQNVTGNTVHMWEIYEAVPFKWIRVKGTINAGSATFEVIAAGSRV